MRVAVICDDRWHPAAVIRAGLQALEDKYTFDFVENASDWSAEWMGSYPVTLFAKANNVSATDETPWMTPAIAEAFRAYVAQGNGLLAIHSGTAGYADQPVLRALLGGVFTSHPAQCAVTIVPRPDHVLVACIEPWTVHDEHYFMLFDDHEADVFMTTSSTNGDQPGAWTRTEGAGRVCVLTPGHNLDVWLTPSFEKVIRNSLAFVGNRD